MEPLLDRKKAIQVLKEYPTEGHRPLQVMTNDFMLYVVKSAKGQIPPLAIQNEILCHYFLKCWEITTPNIALIDLPPSLLSGKLSFPNKSSYYMGTLFGSELIASAIEVNELIFTNIDQLKLLNPIDLLRIALFDLWIENDDRKPSNFNLLLFQNTPTRQLRLVAIDHAFVFASLSHHELKPEFGVMQSFNDSILHSESVNKWCKRHLKTSILNELSQGFRDHVQTCKENFPSIVAAFPQELRLGLDSERYISEFLFDENRNQEVLKAFVDRF